MKNKILILTIISLFLIPLADVVLACLSMMKHTDILPGTNVWYPQFLAMIVVFLLGASIVLWKFNKWVSIASVLCLISAVFVTKQNAKSMVYLFCFDFSCLAMYMISRFTKQQRRRILIAVLIFFFLQSAWVVLQYFNLDPLYSRIDNVKLDDTVGFSGSPNMIGVYFSVVSPAVLSVCPYLFPLVIFGIWCSKTATAWVAFIVSTLFFISHRSKRIFVLALILMAIGSVIYFNRIDRLSRGMFDERGSAVMMAFNSVNKGKLEIYKPVLNSKQEIKQIFTCNPFLGFGIGRAEDLILFTKGKFNSQKIKYRHFHNDYAEMLFSFGWTMVIVFLIWFVDLIRRFSRLKEKKEAIIYASSILAYMICAMALFPTYVAVSAMWFILFYGLLEGVIKDGANTTLV